MVATQYPEDFRLAHTPSQWQQGNTQSQHRLHLQPKLQPSIVRAGLHCQVQCMYDTYQQNLNANFGHYKSVDTGPQKRRHSNCAFPSNLSTPAHQGDIATETSLFQDRCSVPENSKKDSHPLLKALLKETLPESKETLWSPLLYQPIFPIDLKTTTTLSVQRHCKGQEVKNTLESLNLGWSSILNMNQSGESHSNLFEYDLSFTREPPDMDTFQRTLKAFVEQRVEEIGSKRAEKERCASSNIATNQPPAVAAKAVEENRSKGSETNAEPVPGMREAAYCPTFASEKKSTENPQFWRKVATTCKKDQNSPMTVITEVPLDEPTRGQPKSSLHFNPKEENQPFRPNAKTSNDTDQIPGVSRTLKHTTKKDELERCIQPVGTEQFSNVHGAANVPEELQMKMGSEEKTFKTMTLYDSRDSNKENIQDQQQCRILDGDVIQHSKSKSPVDEIQICDIRGSFSAVPIIHREQLEQRRKCEHFSEDACSDLSIALSKNKVMEETGQLEGIGKKAFDIETIRNPEYEDISDDGEMEGLVVEAFVTKPIHNPEYEDISDDSQMEGMGEEASAIKTVNNPQYDNISDNEYELQPAAKLSNTRTEDSSLSTAPETAAVEWPPQIHEPNDELFFEKEGFANLQDLVQIKLESFSDETLDQQKMVSPKTDIYMAHCNTHSVLNASDGEKHSVLGSSAVLKNEKELHDHIVEDDDDWIVIPLEMLDLRFEPESENQEDLETVQCSINHTHRLGSKSASGSSEIEVFETVDSFVQAKEVQILNKFDVGLYWSSPEHDTGFGEELRLLQNSREQFSENEEYDTEDSCDYPSDSKRNHLTVSNILVKPSSVHLTSTTDITFQKEEVDKVINVQNCQTTSPQSWKEKLKRRLCKVKSSGQQKTCRLKDSGKTDTLPLDADSDGKSDQRMRKKRSFTSATENTKDASCSQQKRDAQLLLEENSGLLETRAKSKRDRTKNSKNTIILGSESEDDGDKNCEIKTKETTFFSSNSKEQGEPSFTDQPQPLHSKRHHEEISEPIQDPCCHQPGETSVDFEPVQHRMSRQKILNNDTIVLDSDSEDETEGGENLKKEERNRSHYSDSAYEVEPSCFAQPQQAETGPNEEKADSVIILSSDSDDDNICFKKENNTRSNTAQSPGCPSGTAGLDSGKPNLPDEDNYEVSQHNTYEQTVSEDSDEEVKKIHSSKRAANTEKFFPSSSEDSDDETSVATNDTHSPETTSAHCVVTNKEPGRQSYEESTKKRHHSADGKTESTMGPTSVIPRLFVSNWGGNLKLQSKDINPKSITTSSQVCKKNERYSKRAMVQQNAVKAQLRSRQFSLPNSVGQYAANSLSSTSGSLTESRPSSFPTSALPFADVSRKTTNPPHHLKSKQSTFTPRQNFKSSRTQRSNLYCSPSKLDQPRSPPEGSSSSATQQTDGRKKVTDIWTKDYIDIPDRRRRVGEDSLRTRNDSLRDETSGRSHNESLNELRPEPSSNDLLREAKQQPSHRDFSKETRLEPSHRKRKLRQTHSSHETAAPLMKKSIDDYMLVPKAINREPAREPSGTVGENYKWFEKRVPKKGASRDGKL
ncbi:uncharacterized protein LOC121505205 isoform X2 [Cheilinus undulatus]|uniref:uncharacterized protein LOC121505205 isoform X2 n=1 Tax=Cheilinus undulatus TaxID=241271 RepID=UPI001BD1F565|nr:uncharacterized protein LOC121505205 isoform X2 [Cheilinus undulatus]